MMELNLVIDDLDYDALVTRFMPQILEKANPDEMEPWVKILLLSSGVNAATISKIVAMLPKEKKDELAVNYINKNREKIIELLAGMAEAKGIKADIKDVSAELK